MTLDELITSLARVRHIHGNVEVNVAHASTPDPALTRPQTHSALFPLLDVDTTHGVTLVESNYINRYIPAVFPDKEPVD